MGPPPEGSNLLLNLKIFSKFKEEIQGISLEGSLNPKGTPCEVQKKNFNYLGFPFKMKFRLWQKYTKCFYLKFLFKSSIFGNFYLKNLKNFWAKI